LIHFLSTLFWSRPREGKGEGREGKKKKDRLFPEFEQRPGQRLLGSLLASESPVKKEGRGERGGKGRDVTKAGKRNAADHLFRLNGGEK